MFSIYCKSSRRSKAPKHAKVLFLLPFLG
uniref:Uncharacterized protein n=1 Tax=Arundo donax TaxID=35708 RepID=A0A0A9AXE5_ARUDO